METIIKCPCCGNKDVIFWDCERHDKAYAGDEVYDEYYTCNKCRAQWSEMWDLSNHNTFISVEGDTDNEEEEPEPFRVSSVGGQMVKNIINRYENNLKEGIWK